MGILYNQAPPLHLSATRFTHRACIKVCQKEPGGIVIHSKVKVPWRFMFVTQGDLKDTSPCNWIKHIRGKGSLCILSWCVTSECFTGHSFSSKICCGETCGKSNRKGPLSDFMCQRHPYVSLKIEWRHLTLEYSLRLSVSYKPLIAGPFRPLGPLSSVTQADKKHIVH